MIPLLLSLAGCSTVEAVGPAGDGRGAPGPTEPATGLQLAGAGLPAADPFTAFLATDGPVADGFSWPVGPGWTACGDGCWSRAAAGDVLAVADGAWAVDAEGAWTSRHTWYDDEVKHETTVTWRGLERPADAPARVRRGAVAGRATRLDLTVADVSGTPVRTVDELLAGHARLPVPQSEPVLALVSRAGRAVQVLVHGSVVRSARGEERMQVGFGQGDGVKDRRGDNRTPSGAYHVVGKTTGPFAGDYGAFYGGYWIKLDYPNPWDAARGVDEGLIDADTQRAITTAWWARAGTPQKTALGGGIGFHGWASEWPDASARRMSWGCVVMHLYDAPSIYAALPVGAMVVLF